MFSSVSPSFVYADDNTNTDVITEVTSESEEITTEVTEVTTEEITTEEVTTEEVTTEATEEVTTEDVKEATNTDTEADIIVFDHIYNNVDVSNIKSTDLFVQTSDSSIFTKNTNVVSNYEDVYIINCNSVDESKSVYSYYKDKVDFICDLQDTITLSDNEDTADLSDINNTNDAIATLDETIDETKDELKNVSSKDYSNYIALIDSGVNNIEKDDVAISVIDDSTNDTVGHGTKMYKYIKEENPDAKILSIKAFDSNKTDIANIYAAIKLAIESKVAIINLSFVGMNIEDNSIIKEVIQEAINNGITIVGAAGNYNSNAKNYIPGCINDAIIVGACDENGDKISTSNYGNTVDFNVIANSTSEAAARMSSFILLGNTNNKVFINKYDNYDNNYIYINNFILQWNSNGDPITYTNVMKILNNSSINGQLTGYIKNTGTSQRPVFKYVEYKNGVENVISNNGICIDHGYRAQGTDNNDGAYAPVIEYAVTNTNIKKLVYYGVKRNYDAETIRKYILWYLRDGSADIISNSDIHHKYESNHSTEKDQFFDWENNINIPLVRKTVDPRKQATGLNRLGFTDGYTRNLLTAATGSGASAIARPSDYSTYVTNALNTNVPNTFWVKELVNLDRYAKMYYYNNNDQGLVFQNVLIWGDNPEPKGMLQIFKVDSNNSPLSGATFGIYNSEADANNGTNAISTKTTNGNGIANFTNLTAKTYYVKEISAPTGYIKDNTVYSATINLDNTFATSDQNYGYVYNDIYYKNTYSDLSSKTTDGLRAHFLSNGMNECRNGSAYFNVVYYRENSFAKTVDTSIPEEERPFRDEYTIVHNVDPSDYEWFYLHYLNWGANEGRLPMNIDNYKNMSVGRQNNNEPVIVIKVKNDSNTEISFTKTPNLTNAPAGYRYTVNDQTVTNCNYSLAGTKYELYNGDDSDTNKKIGEIVFDKNGNVTTFTNSNKYTNISFNSTTKKLVVNSASNIWSNNKFYLAFKETVTGKGFNKQSHNIETITLSQSKSISLTDPPLGKDPYVNLVKTTSNTNISGAKFTLAHYDNDISVDTWTYSKLTASSNASKLIKTYSRESDDTGKIDLNPDNLDYAYGYLVLTENKPASGYSDKLTFKIDDNTISSNHIVFRLKANSIEYLNEITNEWIAITGNPDNTKISAINMPLRYDFKVVKHDVKDDTVMSNVKFKLDRYEGNTFFESHEFTTTDNGEFNSKTASNREDVWFRTARQGDESDYDATKGVLTDGRYVLTEIETIDGYNVENEIARFTIVNGVFNYVDKNNTIINKAVIKDGDVFVLEDPNKSIDNNGIIYNAPTPKFSTVASAIINENGETVKSKIVPVLSGQTIRDEVSYENLKYNTTYTLYGRLMLISEDGESAEIFKDATGKEITSISTFTTASSYSKSKYECSGTETVDFTDVDFTGFDNRTFVIYETLYLGNLTKDDIDNNNYVTGYPEEDNNPDVVFPFVHEDINDTNQIVKTPGIHTNATAADTTKTITSIDEVTIVDTVSYTNLVVGKKYIVSGKLYIRPEDDDDTKEYTDEELDAMAIKDKDGNYITAEQEVIPENPDGTVDITFTFDAKLITQETATIVAFEDLYPEDRSFKYCTHADLRDVPQTTYKPTIRTTAKSINNRKEVLFKDGKFIDTVYYTNLEPGKLYYLTGTIMDKDTGKVIDIKADYAEAEDKFETSTDEKLIKPNGAIDGSFDLTFTIPDDVVESLRGKDIVIFEVLRNNKGNIVATHSDIEDKDQELFIPDIKTKLVDRKTEDHIAYPEEEVTLVDTVTYKKLIPGKEYVMNGTLMNKETGKEFTDENGNKITSSKKFTASETGDGTVDVEFKFNAKALKMQGTTIVAFETCMPFESEIPVGVHADITDVEQTVYIPDAHTNASITDFSDLSKIKLTDEVIYTNLIPNKTYIVRGYIVDKDGKEINVKSEKEFTPTTKDGTVDVNFEFNAENLSGKYVVFEEIFAKITDKDGNEKETKISEHKDLKDDKQTVEINSYIDIQIAKADKDKVKYFLKGAEITIYKEDGTVAKDVNGKDCVGITDENGNVSFKVPYGKYYAKETKAPSGYSLSTDKYEVIPKTKDRQDITHDIIKITVLDSAIIIPPVPKTGDIILFATIAIAIIGGIGVIFFKRRKKLSK